MKNRKLLLIVSLVLALTMSLGGTLAYLTDTDADVNTMVLGSVQIIQNEQERNAEGKLVEFTQNKPAIPAVYDNGKGSIKMDETPVVISGKNEEVFDDTIKNVLDKFVTVTNTGKSDAYFRTIVAIEVPSQDFADKLLHTNENTVDYAMTPAAQLVKIDGTYFLVKTFVYQDKLAADETSPVSLKQLFIDPTAKWEDIEPIGNEWEVRVLSQAIQADGFADPAVALNEGYGEVTADNLQKWMAKETLLDDIASPSNKEDGWPSNNPPVKVDVTVKTNDELADAIKDKTVKGIAIVGDLTYDWGGDSYENSKALLLAGKTIIGVNEESSITFKGYGSANPIKDLTLNSITVKDVTIGDNEGSWEHGYLEFEGLKANNVNFADPIMLDGTCELANCTFDNEDESWYGVWVEGGNVAFTDCTFKGTRGLKIHEAYSTDVASVTVDGCSFTLDEKPGVVIGTVDKNTAVTIENSHFNTQAGDQGEYIYESDTTDFKLTLKNNTRVLPVENVSNADGLVAALENMKSVALENDVKIEPAGMSNAYGTTGLNVKEGQTIDGNGHILDIKGAGGTWDSGINTTGGLIKDITVTGSFRGIFINHNSEHYERVVLENVTIEGTTYTISCDQGKKQGLTATNSTFKGWTSYAATLGDAKFVDCYFGEGNGYAYCRPYAPTEFVGCEFEAGYTLDPRAAVTFENCTLGGVALTSANLADLVTDTAKATVK